ncbi:cobalamin biosynthesis protein CobT [Escherichia coli]|uniref:cobaltochelatase CobT-related protein n=1 Tax=Escherichia coli TaxID=562 RepID=UPI001321AAC6|nr:cobalamin biosynthesis protein CobT [Escherichia coli]MWF18738.1 cobalamin biosynthesis protein CobT [Escherichia coli]
MSKKRSIKEVQDFRDSVKRVVALLSGKNIPVAERGDDAYVRYNDDGEPILVNIPSIPDNATPALMNAVRGFLDHEVAHILFTDIRVSNKMREKGRVPSWSLWNALEDVFIERKMGQVFNGTRRNLMATQRLIIEKVFKPKASEAIAYCGKDQRALFLNFFLCPVVRAWDGQAPFVDFMDEYWPVIEKPISLLKEHGIDVAVRNMSCTEDCVKVAATIAKILKDTESESKGKESTPGKTSDPSDADQTDASGENNEDNEDHETPSSLDNHKSIESESHSKHKHDNNDSDDSDNSESSETIFDDTENDKEVSDSDASDNAASESLTADHEKRKTTEDGSSDIPTPSKMSLEEALEELDSIEDEVGGMTEDALSETIKSELTESSKSEYRPYNRSYDFIGSIDQAEAHIKRLIKTFSDIDLGGYPISRYRIVPEGNQLFDKYIEKHLSSGVSSTLAKDLERAIASRNRVQFIPGQRRGRIHGSSIYRLAMNDDRVFRKKEESKAVNACVQQVIDLSASMSGITIQLALASAYTIADALDRINVPNIITGFTTFGSHMAAGELKAVKYEFSRFESLMLPIIKNWNEKVNSREVRSRMGCVGYTFPLLNNVDGESIASLASLFSGRMEDRKIMLVLSDGAPWAVGRGFDAHLRSVAKQIETQTDIDLMAIGIMTDAPERFYSNHALVTSVDSLGSSVVTELSRIILK